MFAACLLYTYHCILRTQTAFVWTKGTVTQIKKRVSASVCRWLRIKCCFVLPGGGQERDHVAEDGSTTGPTSTYSLHRVVLLGVEGVRSEGGNETQPLGAAFWEKERNARTAFGPASWIAFRRYHQEAANEFGSRTK